jgi:hypothetical protein
MGFRERIKTDKRLNGILHLEKDRIRCKDPPKRQRLEVLENYIRAKENAYTTSHQQRVARTEAGEKYKER